MEILHNGFTLETPTGTFPLSTDSILLADFVRLPRNANVSMTETHMIILTTFACHINTTKKNVNLLAVYFLKQMGNQTATAHLETNHFIGILMAPVNIHQETILNQTHKSLNQTTVNMQNNAYTDN